MFVRYHVRPVFFPKKRKRKECVRILKFPGEQTIEMMRVTRSIQPGEDPVWYGCDGKLASAIVICTYLLSLMTLPLFLIRIPGL